MDSTELKREREKDGGNDLSSSMAQFQRLRQSMDSGPEAENDVNDDVVVVVEYFFWLQEPTLHEIQAKNILKNLKLYLGSGFK